MTRQYCSCSRTRRNWLPDGTCQTCNLTVHESSIMDAVKAVLISDPNCLLWRNEIGHNTHFPNGIARKHPIKYGICNPGGADLIGCYGPRFLAVETKTPIGRQSPDQANFERYVTTRNGIYALIRSESQARELLARLQAGGTP